MTVQDALQILRDIKSVAFATVDENGLPQVRIIDVMLVEGEKLYFCTARGKSFYKQLICSGNVAVTGMNKDWQMVRLNGKAHRLEEQKMWLERIFAANPSMNEVYPGDSRYILEPFCIDAGQIEFYDLGQVPIYRVNLSFGGSQKAEKGFRITESCIGCGLCLDNCPQKCIDMTALPAVIRQENCLRCGKCCEICPSGAIRSFE